MTNSNSRWVRMVMIRTWWHLVGFHCGCCSSQCWVMRGRRLKRVEIYFQWSFLYFWLWENLNIIENKFLKTFFEFELPDVHEHLPVHRPDVEGMSLRLYKYPSQQFWRFLVTRTSSYLSINKKMSKSYKTSHNTISMFNQFLDLGTTLSVLSSTLIANYI